VKRFRKCLLLVALFVSVAASLRGQSPTTLGGVVEDQTGAVVPGASVALVDRQTGQSHRGLSDDLGQFSFDHLPPGSYSLSATLEESKTSVDVEVLSRPLHVTLVMKVVVEEQVNVSAAEPDPLSPGRNSDAVDFSSALLRSLPTDSQNLVPLISNFVAPAAGGSEGTSLVVDGLEADEIDDMPASAIKRVTIDRNPYAAEFRRPGKARIEITTKQGSLKRYHGHFGIFARDSLFDATNALAALKPGLSRQLYEGSLGGPLGQRTSFFLSTQHLFDTESATVHATILGPSNQPVSLSENAPKGLRRTDYLARLDFHLEHQTITALYGFDEKFESNREVGGFVLPERGISTAGRGHRFQLVDQIVVSPSLLDTIRLQVRRSSLRLGTPPVGPAIDINGDFSSGPSQISRQQQQTSFQLENAVAYSHKNQIFRFGGATRTRFIDLTDNSNFGGTFQFSNLAEFRERRPDLFTINRGQPNASFTIREVSGFFQDEIRFHSSLSVVGGLRYDWQSTIPNHTGLAPRFALAYAPGDRKTVFRAGAGLFYEYLPEPATEQAFLLNGARIQQLVITNPSYPDALNGAAVPPSLVRVSPDLTTPYLLQASFSVERDLDRRNHLAVEYETLRGIHLFRSRDLNAPLPATGLRPDTQVLNVNQVESAGWMRSNALSLSYRGRPGKRLTIFAQYTLAKTVNDTSGVFSLPANNYDLRAEMGRADFDRRHRLNLAGVVNLPRNIRIGTVLNVGSGIPFDITTGSDNNHDSHANDRPSGVTRNMGEGPGLMQLDFRLSKLFSVWRPFNRDRSASNLEINLDALNAINHPNYPNFVGVITSPVFGRPNAALPARTIQMSLAYRF
jgi:hypothetical protein